MTPFDIIGNLGCRVRFWKVNESINFFQIWLTTWNNWWWNWIDIYDDGHLIEPFEFNLDFIDYHDMLVVDFFHLAPTLRKQKSSVPKQWFLGKADRTSRKLPLSAESIATSSCCGQSKRGGKGGGQKRTERETFSPSSMIEEERADVLEVLEAAQGGEPEEVLPDFSGRST